MIPIGGILAKSSGRNGLFWIFKVLASANGTILSIRELFIGPLQSNQ